MWLICRQLLNLHIYFLIQEKGLHILPPCLCTCTKYCPLFPFLLSVDTIVAKGIHSLYLWKIKSLISVLLFVSAIQTSPNKEHNYKYMLSDPSVTGLSFSGPGLWSTLNLCLYAAHTGKSDAHFNNTLKISQDKHATLKSLLIVPQCLYWGE